MQAQEQKKIKFSGTVISVQPRSNVWRYRLDNRNHGTTGYNIFIRGNAEGEIRYHDIWVVWQNRRIDGCCSNFATVGCKSFCTGLD